MMRQFSCFFAVIAGFYVFAMIGCNNPDAKYTRVEGVVTYNQQPVEGAIVMFLPANHAESAEPAAGSTDANGRYTLTSSGAVDGGRGILPGEYSVTVRKSVVPPDPDQAAYDQGQITYDQ